MVSVNPKKLDEMSKSQFGKYSIAQENKFLKFYYNLFLKNTTFRSFLHGGITSGVIVYSYLTKDFKFLFYWFGYIVFINVTGTIYWFVEKKRLGKELQKTEKELKEIYQEIQERKEYFQKVKDKLNISKN